MKQTMFKAPAVRFDGTLDPRNLPSYLSDVAAPTRADKRERLRTLYKMGAADLFAEQVSRMDNRSFDATERLLVERLSQPDSAFTRCGAQVQYAIRDDVRTYRMTAGDARQTWAPWNAQTQRIRISNHPGRVRQSVSVDPGFEVRVVPVGSPK